MIRRGSLALTAVIWFAGAGLAQEWIGLNRGADRGPVEIQADSLKALEGGERIEATGGVVITWGDGRLTADRVVYARGEARAEASGEVTLEDESGNVLHCQHLTLDLDTQTGEVEEGSLWIAEEGYRVWGKRFRKTGAASYELDEGGFTACDGTWPSWRIEADRLEVELEGYLVARGAVFWVEGVPVLYTPYVVFPVKRERQSGFLLPTVGFGDRDGFLLALQYYWAVADYIDLTMLLQYQSRRGFTEGAEVRYVIAEGHEGEVGGTFLRDRKDDSIRYTVNADHRSRFADGSRVRLHVDYVGDRNQLRDLGDDLDERSVEFLENYLLGTRDPDPGTMFLFFDYFQVLEGSQSSTRQVLPSLGLLGRETPVAGPILWDPTAIATNFVREKGDSGERLILDPGFATDLGTKGLGLAARIGYRQHLYRVDGETVSRGAARAEASTGMSLVREYGSLVHTVEPTVRFLFEESGRGGDPPQFDPADDFSRRVEFKLLLETRLLRREDGTAAAGLDFEQDFDVDDTDWTPARAEVFFRPSRYLELTADGVYDLFEENRWRRWSAWGDGRDRRGDRLYLGYRYVKNEAGYLDGGLELALTRGVSVQYRQRYSARDDRTLEELYGLRLVHPCWEVFLTYSRNWDDDDGEFDKRIFAVLELRGLGKLGKAGGILP